MNKNEELTILPISKRVSLCTYIQSQVSGL